MKHTDGSRLDHVTDGESLDRLVFGCASRAVGATDRLDVATALLVTSAVENTSWSAFGFSSSLFVGPLNGFWTIVRGVSIVPRMKDTEYADRCDSKGKGWLTWTPSS